MLENTERAMKKEQFRETGNTGYTRRGKTQGTQDEEKHRVHKTKKNKTSYNTICVEHHYAQTNTNNVNKTCALPQTTGGKD